MSKANSSWLAIGPSDRKAASLCTGQDLAYGDEEIDTSVSDFNPGDACSGLSRACPQDNAGTYKDYLNEQKDARQQKNDAQSALVDAQSDIDKLNQDNQQKLNDISDKVDDEKKSFDQKNQKMMNELQDAIKGEDADLAKQLQQLQSQFNKWDEEYVEMRDQYRAAEQAVAQATYDVEVQCRAEAQQRLDETNKRIDAHIASLNGKKINHSTTSVAGSSKRRFTEYQNLRQTQYAEAYRLCLQGSSPAGAAVNSKIKTAKDNLERTKQKLADMQAVIEHQRQQAKDAYAKAQQTADQNKQMYQQRIQQAAQMAYQNLQTDMQRAQRDYNSQQQAFQTQMNTAQQKMQIQYQNVAQANQDYFTAQARVSCAASVPGTRMSNSTADRLNQKMDKATEAMSAFNNACSVAGIRCGVDPSTLNSSCNGDGSDSSSSSSHSGGSSN